MYQNVGMADICCGKLFNHVSMRKTEKCIQFDGYQRPLLRILPVGKFVPFPQL